MKESVVWAAAGRLEHGEPVEIQRIKRCRAIWKPPIVDGDTAFKVWRSKLPLDVTILMLFDFRKHWRWKLLEYVNDDPATRVLPPEEEERMEDLERTRQRHKAIKERERRRARDW